MNPNQIGAHRTHCCVHHGCKYGLRECPVVSGEVLQDYPCEDCGGDGITLKFLKKAHELKIIDFSLQEDELLVLLDLSRDFPNIALKLEVLRNKGALVKW